MSWAANAEASGHLKPAERLVLIAMAEPCDVDGRKSFLAVSTLAKRTGLSDRQVARIVRAIEGSGHIVRATDQGPAEYIRADRRPVVYDLAMRSKNRSYPQPRGDTDDMSSRAPRGDKSGRHGVTPMSDEPTTEHNYGKPPKPPAPTEPCPHGCDHGWLKNAEGAAVPCATCPPKSRGGRA